MNANNETMKKEAGGATTSPTMPQLPDGFGLNFDQVKSLLAEKNKIILPPDDPLLMQVTLLNAFLAEENRLMERHKGAIAQLLASRTDNFVKSVTDAAAKMEKTFSDSAVSAMQTGFEGMEKNLASHQTNIRWWSIIALISAVVNVAAFVWRAVK